LNYCFADNEDPAKSQERVFVLYGDIPWPYPQQGNIVGFSASHARGNPENPRRGDTADGALGGVVAV